MNFLNFRIKKSNFRQIYSSIHDYDPNRKCYRLVGEVLIQSTVAETKPLLEQQETSIKELVKTYRQKVEAKEQEIKKFQEDNHIRIESAREVQAK